MELINEIFLSYRRLLTRLHQLMPVPSAHQDSPLDQPQAFPLWQKSLTLELQPHPQEEIASTPSLPQILMTQLQVRYLISFRF
jgi:hypothetical protein